MIPTFSKQLRDEYLNKYLFNRRELEMLFINQFNAGYYDKDNANNISQDEFDFILTCIAFKTKKHLVIDVNYYGIVCKKIYFNVREHVFMMKYVVSKDGVVTAFKEIHDAS